MIYISLPIAPPFLKLIYKEVGEIFWRWGIFWKIVNYGSLDFWKMNYNSERLQKCFKRISNSNLTAERLRFRHKRQSEDETITVRKEDLINEIALTRPLTILDDIESSEGKAPELFLKTWILIYCFLHEYTVTTLNNPAATKRQPIYPVALLYPPIYS